MALDTGFHCIIQYAQFNSTPTYALNSVWSSLGMQQVVNGDVAAAISNAGFSYGSSAAAATPTGSHERPNEMESLATFMLWIGLACGA